MTALDCARADQLPEVPTSAGELPSRPLSLVPLRRVPLRVGVIGLGRQALDDHLPGLASCEAAELVAVCDEDPEIVREHQYRCRVPGYTDFTAMLG